METLLGFRVQGIPPEDGAGFVSDMFELKQAAIECAERIVKAGWTDVTCERVEQDELGETAEPVWPPRVPKWT